MLSEQPPAEDTDTKIEEKMTCYSDRWIDRKVKGLRSDKNKKIKIMCVCLCVESGGGVE